MGGYSGDGGIATGGQLNMPTSAVPDISGNVLVADTINHRARVIVMSPNNPGYPLAGCGGACTWTPGDIYTIAGTGTAGYNGDGIAATSAQLVGPTSVIPLPTNVGWYVTDTANSRVRVVAQSKPLQIASVAAVSTSVTSGYDAAWTVSIENTSANALQGVAATLHAKANESRRSRSTAR